MVHDKPVQMAICWRDFVYRISGVKGNLYLFWCQSLQVIKRESLRSERRIDKVASFPLLVNTDGRLRILAYYPLVMGQMQVERVYFLCPAAVKPSYNLSKPLYPHDKASRLGQGSPNGRLQQLQSFQIENEQRREIVGDHEVKGYEQAIEQLRQSSVAMGFVDPESEVDFLVYLQNNCPWFLNEDECLAMPAGEFHDKIAAARQLYYLRRQYSKQLDGPGLLNNGNNNNNNSDGSVTLREGPTQKEIEDSQVRLYHLTVFSEMFT